MERRYNVIAPAAAHVEISAKMPRVYAIASFDDHHSPKTQRALRDMLRAHPARYVTESTFIRRDAKGSVYGLLVYSTREERAAAFQVLAKGGAA